MTTALRHSDANRVRLARIREALDEMLDESLKRGFFGTVALEIAVQDGTIQCLRRRKEQLDK